MLLHNIAGLSRLFRTICQSKTKNMVTHNSECLKKVAATFKKSQEYVFKTIMYERADVSVSS